MLTMLVFLLGFAAFPVVRWMFSKRTPYLSLPVLTDEAVDELIASTKKAINFQKDWKQAESKDRLALLSNCPLLKTHRPTAQQAAKIQSELLHYIDEHKQFRRLIKYPLLLEEHIEKVQELQHQRETDKLLEA